jgi:ABC-type methionine transport system ATPase subunit
MIQIENISKVFRTSEVETVALNHVNLEVKEIDAKSTAFRKRVISVYCSSSF